jgi:NAD-dependent deacetylase
MLPPAALQTAITAAEKCDVFFSIGTSSVVYPAADLWRRAKERDALVVEINKDPTPLTPMADYSFIAKAGEILPRLVEQIHVHQSRDPQ